MAKLNLPVIQDDCNRCGECCRKGGDCLLRQYAGLAQPFNGRCETLTDLPDGTTACYLVEHVLKDNGSLRLWAEQYLNGKCDFPDDRKEICASVHP